MGLGIFRVGNYLGGRVDIFSGGVNIFSGRVDIFSGGVAIILGGVEIFSGGVDRPGYFKGVEKFSVGGLRLFHNG